MSDVTRILDAINRRDPRAASELLPLVYEELRRLAAQKLSHELPSQTLQATDLVHEAYLRLVGHDRDQNWDNRGHFFAAAAEAMRRILVDRARQKNSLKHGADRKRVSLEDVQPQAHDSAEELLALDDALGELEQHDAQAAQFVKLRFFAGFGHQEAAEALGIGRRAADRLWVIARAWLYVRIGDDA